VPQWRIENFSTLTGDRAFSECFEAGIGTWCVGSDCPAVPPAVLIALRVLADLPRRRLNVFPKGNGAGEGTHLTLYLEAQDTMWAPTAECTFTLINQSDASRSRTRGQSQ
jgi:hypothetical protein